MPDGPSGLILSKARNLPVDRFLKRNECFSTNNAGNTLNFICENVFQMLIIPRIDFDKQRVIASCIMAFNNFRDIPEFLDHIAEMTGMLGKYLCKHTFKADQHRIDLKSEPLITRSGSDADTLMNCCTLKHRTPWLTSRYGILAIFLWLYPGFFCSRLSM